MSPGPARFAYSNSLPQRVASDTSATTILLVKDVDGGINIDLNFNTDVASPAKAGAAVRDQTALRLDDASKLLAVLNLERTLKE